MKDLILEVWKQEDKPIVKISLGPVSLQEGQQDHQKGPLWNLLFQPLLFQLPPFIRASSLVWIFLPWTAPHPGALLNPQWEPCLASCTCRFHPPLGLYCSTPWPPAIQYRGQEIWEATITIPGWDNCWHLYLLWGTPSHQESLSHYNPLFHTQACWTSPGSWMMTMMKMIGTMIGTMYPNSSLKCNL